MFLLRVETIVEENWSWKWSFSFGCFWRSWGHHRRMLATRVSFLCLGMRLSLKTTAELELDVLFLGFSSVKSWGMLATRVSLLCLGVRLSLKTTAELELNVLFPGFASVKSWGHHHRTCCVVEVANVALVFLLLRVEMGCWGWKWLCSRLDCFDEVGIVTEGY